MAKIDYPNSSPYALTPQSSWYIGRYVHRRIEPASDDTTVVIAPKYNLRPDRMSQDLYGTPLYWWVFMIRNMNVIRDPIYDFRSGVSIVVPSRQTLVQQKFG